MLQIPVKRRRTDMLVSSCAAAPPSANTLLSQASATITTPSASHPFQLLPVVPATSNPQPNLLPNPMQQAVDRQTHGRSVSPDTESIAAAAESSDTQKQLRLLALEVEPVVIRRSSPSQTSTATPVAVTVGLAGMSTTSGQLQQQYRSGDNRPAVIGYRPTYRAMLAKRGYLVKNTLGSGSYSKVKKVFFLAKRAVLRQAAVKIIDRQKAPQDYQDKFLPRELKHWPRLRHPNLVALIDCFQDSQRVYMILEYADGGDALKHIQSTGAIREDLARTWATQITSAVGYMHKLDIAHRDLKLENLLIDSSNNIKLCDFGFVREAATGDLSQTYCGSKSYAAPEILQGRPYDPKKADIWAVGVILYIFVTGKMPFDETKGTRNVLEEQRILNFHWSRSRHLTHECQTLIRRMFTWQFETRPSIHDVMSDCWFRLPTVQIQQVLMPSSGAIVGGEHRAVPHQSVATAAAVQAVPVLGQSVEAGVRLAPLPANTVTVTATTTNGAPDQHHRQLTVPPTGTVGSRQQHQQQQQQHHQIGDHSRSSCVSAPSTPFCVIPVVDVGPSTVIGLAGHHVLQQQHQQLQQSQVQYSKPVMLPAGSL